ncbi:MAG: hypothetical protein M5U28_37935 [Sandaracinaceae bacterium]|nr:hypothetical protein [Sandaracinaceae bacterium]
MRRAALGVLLGLCAASPALAQDDALARAEAAYLEVDFDATHQHALAALRAGGNTPEQLVRVYQLLGIAASALGREDEARDHFVRMLGLDRDAELDASVPPRLRDPFLEARGVWAARTGRLGIQVGLDRARPACASSSPTRAARPVACSCTRASRARRSSSRRTPRPAAPSTCRCRAPPPPTASSTTSRCSTSTAT